MPTAGTQQLDHAGVRRTTCIRPGRRTASGSSSAGGNPSQLEIMNADGTGIHRVTNAPTAVVSETIPPGRRTDAGSPTSAREQGRPIKEIWLVHPDGTGNHQLTNLQASRDSPAWSPDGKQIAFSSNARGGHFGICADRPGRDRHPRRQPDHDRRDRARLVAGRQADRLLARRRDRHGRPERPARAGDHDSEEQRLEPGLEPDRGSPKSSSGY